MCWMCDQDSKANLNYRDLADFIDQGGPARLHFERLAQAKLGDAMWLTGDEFMGSSFQFGAGKYYDAFPADGVGEVNKVLTVQSPADILAAAALIDTVPGDTSTTATLGVGQTVRGTLDTPGDFDFYKIELQAGVTYDLGMYGVRGDPLQGYSGVLLPDAFLEVRDSTGAVITFGDGGGNTQLNTANSGLDVLFAFTAETTGTYYLNARAFDNEPSDGDTGEFVGDYDLFARVSTYVPHYDLDSPLHTLDWGTQFDGTSRNPDGAEGPRPTGNPIENKLSGKNDIYVYFAREGEVFVDNGANPGNLTTTIVANGLQPWEKNAFNSVFAEYEKVADIDYIETDDRYAADIVVITYEGTPGPGVSLLGRMSPPDTPSEGQTEYNAGDERWTQEGLAPGGFYFGTLIHEFGHGHGMSHPHDNGGRSSVMLDGDTESGFVEETTPFNYTLGDFDLNQGVYTMMSYMDGWQLSPYGQADSTDGYGYLGSLMAFDIAVMQDKYGVNEDWATGNDTYVLRDVNAAATFDANDNMTSEATSYKSIWDADGTDSIVYSGARDANIDLRAASLQYEEGGGGWISYAFGIYGGFTIANGVTIENAFGGSGNDTLNGNAAANLLNGGAGIDVMAGGGGDDFYEVDNFGDQAIEAAGLGYDIVRSSSHFGLAAGSSIEVLWAAASSLTLTGNELGNDLWGSSGLDILNGGGGNDAMSGLGGDDFLDGGTGADTMFGGTGNDFYHVDNAGDQAIELAGEGHDVVSASASYTLSAGSEVEVLWAAVAGLTLTGNEVANDFWGSSGSDTLNGGGGNDAISGFDGNDILDGGAGDDVLIGGGGADAFRFTTATGPGNVDQISDFEIGVDRIELSQTIFGLAAGPLSVAAFRTGSSAQDADDRIIYDSATGALYFDADGAGGAAAVQFATLSAGLNLSASDFAVI